LYSSPNDVIVNKSRRMRRVDKYQTLGKLEIYTEHYSANI